MLRHLLLLFQVISGCRHLSPETFSQSWIALAQRCLLRAQRVASKSVGGRHPLFTLADAEAVICSCRRFPESARILRLFDWVETDFLGVLLAHLWHLLLDRRDPGSDRTW